MKYPYLALGAMDTDVLESFRERVKLVFERQGCDEGKLGGCGDENCWCSLAERFLARTLPALTEEDISTLLCETKISVLFRLSLSGLCEIYEKDLAFRPKQSEWEESLRQTADLEAELRKLPQDDIDAIGKVLMAQSETTRKRIAIAEALLEREIVLPAVSGKRDVMLNTDMLLYGKYHPFYAAIFAEDNCKATAVSENDIVLHLYCEEGLSAAHVWEAWQAIFVDQLSEFLFVTDDTVDMNKKIADETAN